jgi:putative ABC transport system permease protein
MLKNYILVAMRSFLRQKFYAVLNVLGLASGIVCTLFIYLWVSDEYQKDKFHQDASKIVQVLATMTFTNGGMVTWANIPGPLLEKTEEIPGVEFAVLSIGSAEVLFQYGEKSFLERGNYSEPDFFRIFSFPLLKGNMNHTTFEKNYVAISQSLANKLFGNEDPIGKSVKVSGRTDVSISAVFADVSPKSSMKFEFVLPFQLYREEQGDGFQWNNFNQEGFLKLRDEEEMDKVANAINQAAQKHMEKDDNIRFFLQPFPDRYLHGNFKNGQAEGGRIVYVTIFSWVGIFILIIACINFMNMATARALTRAKEVGVRKVVGAERVSLVVQFMTESFLAAAGATILAAGFALMVLPLFNAVVSKQIEVSIFDLSFLLFCVGITFVTGLLSGSYPAFILSSFKPANVLKGILGSRLGGENLRRGLVVFQFALTVILIASALVLYRQINFIRNIDLGYVRESVLAFQDRSSNTGTESFMVELQKQPGVLSVSRADQSLIHVDNQTNSVIWQGQPADDQQLFRAIRVDYKFIETMGLKLIQGRSFSKDFNDTSNFVISRMTAQIMGFADPVGQKMSLWGKKGTIVGVVDDFHSTNVGEAIDPVILFCSPRGTSQVFVRFDQAQITETLARLEKLNKNYSPGYPFEYTFLDDDFEKLYTSERITGALAFGFTVMAIIISGLGLLGLTAYTTDRKRKEISIRKTLGASVTGLIIKMSTDFVKLTMIATVIGCSVAYYAMSKFLEGYVYHVKLGWEVFGITAALTIILSVGIVIYQVIKAAAANPVDSLRNE